MHTKDEQHVVVERASAQFKANAKKRRVKTNPTRNTLTEMWWQRPPAKQYTLRTARSIRERANEMTRTTAEAVRAQGPKGKV